MSLIPYSPLGGGGADGQVPGRRHARGRAASPAYINKGGRFTAMAQRFVSEKALASTERFHAIAREAGLDPGDARGRVVEAARLRRV